MAIKVLGTFGLAAGFVWLVSRSPFFPDQTAGSSGPGAAASASSQLKLPALDADTGIIPPETFELLESIQNQGGFQPSMGLLRARFAETEDGPGYTNEEHAVAGPCKGAGLRYVHEICPDCTVSQQDNNDGLPPVVVWTQTIEGAPLLSAATRDCVSVAADGEAIISHLSMGSDRLELDAEMPDSTGGTVPLVAGARRIAVIEMGGWIAVFDVAGRPSTALRDMLSVLADSGWRDAPSLEPEPHPYFEGQRVVVNDRGQYAVVALNRHDDVYQLVTIVTSGVGG